MNDHRAKILVLSGVALCIGLFALTPIAEANCPSAAISLEAVKGERGTMLVVTGRAFGVGCNDVGGGPPPARQPAKRIKILLKQGKTSTLLATVNADSNLGFLVTVTIPANALLGKATLIADAPTVTTKPIPFEVIESTRQ